MPAGSFAARRYPVVMLAATWNFISQNGTYPVPAKRMSAQTRRTRGCRKTMPERKSFLTADLKYPILEKKPLTTDICPRHLK